MSMTRPQMIELAERYFTCVDAKDVEGTLATLSADCSITVETAGVQHHGRDIEIRGMFEGLFERLETLWHGDFRHIVDVESGTIASQFVVRNLTTDGERHEKHNCNVFRVDNDNDRFGQVSVYMMGVNTLT
jgi:ketosteroid isomerase-like protein